MDEITHNLQELEYLKNEKIQIFLRLLFIIIASINIYFYHPRIENGYTFSTILVPPLFVFVLNLFYLFVIKYFPFTKQHERILIAALLDIGLTVYVMYMVDELAAYYAGVLLWFSVGYGMRYSKQIAYIAYGTVLISWALLITTSDFWIQNSSFAFGWLLAYIVIPLYYFKLVERLHQNIKHLHHYAQDSSYKAYHDQLTGIANRLVFEKDLNYYIQEYKKHKQKFALMFIDLDAFKEINDKHGHDIGDRVLVKAAQRLVDIVAHTYRLGGDEFVCMLPYEKEDELKTKVTNLIRHLTLPCDKKNLHLSASIGVARFPSDAQTSFDIKKRADMAMYAAKNGGKNRYAFYDSKLS